MFLYQCLLFYEVFHTSPFIATQTEIKCKGFSELLLIDKLHRVQTFSPAMLNGKNINIKPAQPGYHTSSLEIINKSH